MPKPTTIRAQRIGNRLGLVTTITLPFTVWFQVYEGEEPGIFFLAVEREFDSEDSAKKVFDAWVVETKLITT